MAGIKDVARIAGVSTATASRALTGSGPVAETTRTRVFQAAESLGYVAHASAASLASGRTRSIGLVVPTVDRWFFAAALEGAAQELMAHGLDLTLYDAGLSAERRSTIFGDLLRRGGLDGLITISFKLSPFELAGMQRMGRPVVALGGRVDSPAELPDWFTALQVDHFRAATLATEHLTGLGHREVAFLGRVAEDIEFQVSTERTRGFLQAMAAVGVQVPEEWLVEADFTTSGAFHTVRELLSRPGRRPTAVLCISDEMAIGAYTAALSLGLSVPGDVAVMGIDGHPDGARLGISTVDQSPREQGRRAVRLIVEARKGTPAPRHIQQHLAVRQRPSTAEPPDVPRTAVPSSGRSPAVAG